MVTLPSDKDFNHDVAGPLLHRYLATKKGVTVENRRRILRLIENLTMGRTLEHFKDTEFYHIGTEPTRPALENYLGRMLDIEEFNNKKAYYNVDEVVFGWRKARGA